MKIAYDFHIHTALSPCGDEDMTPNNILNMSLLNGLDAIAITDHNTCGNVKAVLGALKNMGSHLIVIPGMEVETSEEIHVVCLFESLEKILEFEEDIIKALPAVKNRPEIFGKQIYYNELDEIEGYEEKLLLTATSININELFDMVGRLGGIAIPAHIDRSSYSILSSLGFIPEELNIKIVEYSKKISPPEYIKSNEFLERYGYIQSSDAHYLEDISEGANFLEVGDANSPHAIINYLRNLKTP